MGEKVLVKSYREGCDIESREIPPFAGESVTSEGQDFGTAHVRDGSTTAQEADRVADVRERFRFTPEGGGALERAVARYDAGRGQLSWRAANGTLGMRIVQPGDRTIRRITVDGEQVWPEEDDANGRIRELQEMVDRLLAGDAT